jgi:hypothetical protein
LCKPGVQTLVVIHKSARVFLVPSRPMYNAPPRTMVFQAIDAISRWPDRPSYVAVSGQTYTAVIARKVFSGGSRDSIKPGGVSPRNQRVPRRSNSRGSGDSDASRDVLPR